MMGTSNIKANHNMSIITDSKLIQLVSITFRHHKLLIRTSTSLTTLISIQVRSRCTCKIITAENSCLKCRRFTKSVLQHHQRAQVKKTDQDQCLLETTMPMIQSKWSNPYSGISSSKAQADAIYQNQQNLNNLSGLERPFTHSASDNFSESGRA